VRINVNLRPCPISAAHAHGTGSTCAGAPVLIPCPPPDAFTCEVALGECSGRCNGMLWQNTSIHGADCPARPVKVSCSIGGDGTWAGSEVNSLSGYSTEIIGAARDLLFDDCRDRWRIVQALVLGQPISPERTLTHAMLNLYEQRDAVYAALADMVRAESAAWDAQASAVSAIDEWHANDWHRSPETQANIMPSALILAAYVNQVVEQVRAL